MIKKTPLLLLITSLFCFNSFSQAPVAIELEKIIAWVDDEIILKTELAVKEQQFVNGLNNRNGLDNITCQVFETVVINKMMIAKSKIDSVFVEDQAVEQELERRVQQIFSVYGGDEATILEQYGKTLDQLKAEIRPSIKDQLLIQKMQQKISSDVSVTPREVKKFYRTIPKDSLPNISSEVEVAQIIRYPKPSTDAKQKTKAKLEELKKRIDAGESFRILARKYSEDIVSARQGGELGFMERGQLVPEYEAMALSLEKGEVSDIVETQFGFHIIQLIARKGFSTNTRHILLKVNTNENDVTTESNFLDSIRTEIQKDSLDFTVAAFKYNEDQITKQTNGFITDAQGGLKVSVSELDPTTYFKIDKMKNGDISTPHAYINPYTGETGVRIIYLKSKTPPHQINLKDDYQKIKDAALSEKKNRKIEDWFKETKQQLYIKIDEDYNHCKIL